MITKEQQLRIDILFKQIDKLESSDSSTMTPISICNDLISQKFDVNLSYMDICCGKGTILLCLYLRYWTFLENIITDIEKRNEFIHSKIHGNDISKAQASIAKSTMIKIQKIFKITNILYFNIYNYDILGDEKEVINMKRKFSVVITNPPYNSERGDNNQSVDIYPEFVDKAFDLADRYVIMITKSNWMIKPTQKKFREKMVNGYNVDKIEHYSKNPFNGTDIKGGVSYFVIDNQNTKDTFELNGVIYDRKTALHFLPYDLDKKELIVLTKILTYDKLDLSNFRPKGYYNINTNDKRLLDSGDILCHVSEQKGGVKYMNNTILLEDKVKNDISKYKILTSSSYAPYQIGRLIKSKDELCSSSLVNWVFDDEKNRDDFFDYINTKFFRFCVSLINNKIDIGKSSFSLIPHIDFSKLDKVDDENIYIYLNLTEEDIQTIEERCERLKLIKIK